MDENLFYWVWLSLCFPAGSKKMKKLLDEAGDPQGIYEDRDELSYDFLNDAERRRMGTVSLGSAEKVLDDCRRLDVRIVTMADEEYPKRLLDLPGPPAVLYCQGDLSGLDEKLTVAVVGTRDVTDYYKRCTGNISFQLARAGAVIISGCAVGCDEYGHRGALRAGGRTIGVLACGFGVDYPRQTGDLRALMLEKGGALISELPPFVKDDRNYFRVRNRLIAALSEGVLATQVPIRSGATLTADHAIALGRDLFCLPPNDIFSTECMGAAALIREGAQTVFSAKDILDVYLDDFAGGLDAEKLPAGNMVAAVGMRAASSPAKKPEKAERSPAEPPKEEPVKEKAPLPDTLLPSQKKILALMEKGPAHLSDLLEEAGVPSWELLTQMTELELMGLVRGLSGQLYELA